MKLSTRTKLSKRQSKAKRMYKRRPLIKNTQRVGGPNTATCSLTTNATAINENTYYQVNIQGLQPLNPGRQTEIAKNYALYRIARVVLKFTPKFDTFVPGQVPPGSNPTEIPYLYWIMNRYGDLPVAPIANSAYFTQQGAKPIRFDDKTITVAFKPNILYGTGTGAGVGNQIKMTPWLTTDNRVQDLQWQASSVNHFGINFAVIGGATGTATGAVGNFEATIYYQYKNPLLEDTAQNAVKTEVVRYSGALNVVQPVKELVV